ncbi:MAG: trans-sulfuration enzyme family protein [Chitinophagaceae bacterium]
MSRIQQILHSLPVDPLTGAVTTPVYQVSTFVQAGPTTNKGFGYSRTGNPTRKVLEDLIAKLENGDAGFAFASGVAAIDAVAKLLSLGDEIVAVNDIYGGAYRLFTEIYQKFGIKITFVDTTDTENIVPYLNEKTKLIWLESPTNPTLQVSDIRKISNLVKQKFPDCLIVVDNTFATPVSQLPLDIGADIVIHSGTKYLGGHSDVLSGFVVTKTKELSEKLYFIQKSTGGVLGPWDCFLMIRGIETLELRYIAQCKSALQIAIYLQDNPHIDKLYYPGLPQHKNHHIAKVQQNGFFGTIISFSLKKDTAEAATRLVTSTQYFKLAESLGGISSLLCIPSQMTHGSVPREKKLQSGIQDSLIRLSVGGEQVSDLINDLEQALKQ